ncbi:hypothetical protein Bbelb_020340 [Branchiostoma belcheri]|nr:hypothetical protein Bbelb_020340 [Branchiostoma belcheri]
MATATDVSYEKHNDDVENIVPEFGPSPKPTDGGSSKMWTLPVVTSLGLTRRELVIGGCLVGLMVIVLILAVVLGVLAARQATPLVVDVPCSDAGCLQATSQLLQNLNTSAKPCDDFYSYACGGWMLTHPIAPADLERTVHLDVYNQNAEKIRRLLDTPVAFSDTLADQKGELHRLWRDHVGVRPRYAGRGASASKSLTSDINNTPPCVHGPSHSAAYVETNPVLDHSVSTTMSRTGLLTPIGQAVRFRFVSPSAARAQGASDAARYSDNRLKARRNRKDVSTLCCWHAGAERPRAGATEGCKAVGERPRAGNTEGCKAAGEGPRASNTEG